MGLEKILHPFKRIALASTIIYSALSCSGGSDSKQPTSPYVPPPTQTPTTPTPNTPQNAPKLSANTVVLDQTTINSISSYSNGTLNFSNSSGQISSLSTGKIIVGGVSNATPYGFIGKVTSISADRRIVNVQPVGLNEVIENGSFSVRKKLTLSGASLNLRPGVSLLEKSLANQTGFDMNFNINNFVASDLDGNYETRNDQLNFSGSVGINYEMIFEVDIKSPHNLSKFQFENIITQHSNFQVSGVLPFTFFDKTFTLGAIPLQLVTVILPTVPPLPVVITPTLRLDLGISGTAHPRVFTNLSQNSTLISGIKYENGSWTNLSNFTNEFNFSDPSLSQNQYTSVKASLGPKLTAYLYGVLGPTAELSGYLKYNTDYSGSQYWELTGGLEFIAGVRVGPFGFPALEYDKKIVDISKILKQGSMTSTPPPPMTRVDTLYPTKDAYVKWSNLSTATANTNFNLDILRIKRDEGRTYEEALIQFPIENLPSNANISSAIFSLHGSCTGNISGPISFGVSKPIQNWVETGVNFNSKPGYVGNHGGLSVARDSPRRRDVVLTSLAREWSANRNQNYGLAMIINEDLAECTFNSKEHLDSTTRPRLIVSYTMP